jgi:hypothetical protein
MPFPVNSITDVVAASYVPMRGMYYLEPKRFRMADALEYGRRPFIREQAVPETGEAFSACPGASSAYD